MIQDITILPANLVTLVLESFLYGFLVLLFISTVYFLATRQTLAGQSAKHHLTSLVFLTIAALFTLITVHWSIVIYQPFFSFIHLGNAASEDTFYADLAQPSELAKFSLFFVAVLLGDSLVTYRLWIICGKNLKVVIFPVVALIGLAVCCIGFVIEVSNWNPSLRGARFEEESRPWEVAGIALSVLANFYSTGFIISRMLKVKKAASPSKTSLAWFLSIVIESAALQAVWLTISITTILFDSDAQFFTMDGFPAIIGISNTLIHARVGLGWSQGSAGSREKKLGNKPPGNAA
ncbi:hypothetical protein DFH08DRAFT_839825 [Mycena albidolilacea]|uniref:Uncharacterized protein n=1 Tax=Mycena albidolilacea TaxID=1033008 RepID=A0AAD7APZ1_9AGAR|nr:hypothetical protein DFH08DRAFT_839825 [Mycena albidolilacea]